MELLDNGLEACEIFLLDKKGLQVGDVFFAGEESKVSAGKAFEGGLDLKSQSLNGLDITLGNLFWVLTFLGGLFLDLIESS